MIKQELVICQEGPIPINTLYREFNLYQHSDNKEENWKNFKEVFTLLLNDYRNNHSSSSDHNLISISRQHSIQENEEEIINFCNQTKLEGRKLSKVVNQIKNNNFSFDEKNIEKILRKNFNIIEKNNSFYFSIEVPNEYKNYFDIDDNMTIIFNNYKELLSKSLTFESLMKSIKNLGYNKAKEYAATFVNNKMIL